MRVGCPACKAAYDVDDARVPPEGLELQCSSCGGSFVVRKPAAAQATPPVPLPGAPVFRDAAGSIPLPGSATPPPPPAAAPPRADAVPLPGAVLPAGGQQSVPLPPPPDLFGGFDLGDPTDAPTPGAAVDEFDFGDGDFGGFSEATPGGGYDPIAPPPAGTPPSPPAPAFDPFTGAAPPPAAPEFDPFAEAPLPPAAPPLDPFAGAPPPPPSGIGADAFSVPPLSPLTPELLFGDDPPASGSAFGAEASTADLSPGVGEQQLPDLELTLPPLVEVPAATAPGTAELLRDFLLEDEAPPPAEQSAPPQPTQRPTGGPSSPMFHVRRKSGKRIGPFDEETLIRLVRQDQLDGTEEISQDGEDWSLLADVPEVATLLRSRPPPKPRIAPAVAPVLQRGVVVEEPAAMQPPEPTVVETTEVASGARFKLPFAPSRKLVAAVGGGIAGAALLGAGAFFFLGGEEAPPAEDPAQAAAAKAAQIEAQKARQEKRAAATKDLEDAAAALGRGETDEAERLVSRALGKEALPLLEKAQRASAYLLQGEIALRGRRSADAEKAFRAAVDEGSDLARITLGRFLIGRNRGADAVEVLKARADEAAISVLLVEAHLLAGGVPAAESFLQPLETKGAKGLPLSLLRGLVLRDSGKLSEALAAFEKAVAAEPDRGAAQVALVALQLESGKPSDVKAAVDRIEAIFAAVGSAGEPEVDGDSGGEGVEPAVPEEDPSRMEAAQAAAPAEGQRSDAHSEAKGSDVPAVATGAAQPTAVEAKKAVGAKEAKPKRPSFAPAELARLQLLLGYHLIDEGEPEIALAAFDRAAALDPTADEVPAGRGHLRLMAGDPEGAKVLFDEALAMNDASPEALAGLGRVAAAEEDWEGALAKLSRARELAPAVPGVGISLARTQLAAGNPAEALRTIDSVLERRDDLADAHGVRADVLLAQKDFLGAESEARKAIALDKAAMRFHLQLARIREKAGTPATALVAYRDALALAPGDPDVLEGQGRTQLAMGAIVEGVKSLEAALANDPDRTALLEPIADGYLRSRRFQQAIDTIEKQQRLTGAKGLSFKLARALQEQGRTDLAIAQFRKAIAEDPADATAHRFLGFAYKEKNQIRKAVEAFQAYLSMTPDADDRAEIEDEIATLRF